MSKIFDVQELKERVGKLQDKIKENLLDAVLVFEPENITYLTDYFTAGYNTSFQFVIVLPEKDPIIVARYAEHYWVENSAQLSSKVIYWCDGETPIQVILRVLNELKLIDSKIGIEGSSWRASYTLVAALKEKVKNIVDVGNLVTRIRFVKSAKEISLMKKAGSIADKMMEKAFHHIKPGISEREIAVILAKTGVLEGTDWVRTGPISSGERAKHIHAAFSNRKVENQDLVFLEVTPHIRYYHARFMRTIITGKVDQKFSDLANYLTEVQDRALDKVRAGVSCQAPDQIYRQGIMNLGATKKYDNKTFYSVGLMMHPNTFEPLEVNKESNFIFEPGMTFHTYLVVSGFSLSETILVTEKGYERLTNFKRGLLVKQMKVL